jgi:hypothetical protein
MPMTLAKDRFECVLGADGWTVWDHAANAPASAGAILVGCNEAQADAARRMLAERYLLWTDKGPWQVLDDALPAADPTGTATDRQPTTGLPREG